MFLHSLGFFSQTLAVWRGGMKFKGASEWNKLRAYVTCVYYFHKFICFNIRSFSQKRKKKKRTRWFWVCICVTCGFLYPFLVFVLIRGKLRNFQKMTSKKSRRKLRVVSHVLQALSRKKRFFQHLRDQAQKQKKPPCALKRPSCGCKYANNGETGSTTISKGVFERVTLSRLKPKPTGVC